jgi:hypothetical protein
MDSRKISLFCLLLFSYHGFSQITQPLRVAIQAARKTHDVSLIGMQFLGKPYASHALSDQNPEKLVVDLNAFDCVTFIENSLALVQSNGIDSIYRKGLIHNRYAGDSITYEKRYHYFSDAMRNLRFPLVGTRDMLVQAPKSFSFLSTYLSTKPAVQIDLVRLRERERALSQQPFVYIPIALLNKLLPLLKSGDLIGLVSKKSSIDFLHTGMVYRQNGHVYLLHASQEFNRVMISKLTLVDYLKTHKQFIGVCAFRPIFKE